MKLPFVTTFLVAAALAGAQLYPAKLGMVQSASFRLGDPATRIELKMDEGQAAKVTGVLSDHAQSQANLSKQMSNADAAKLASIQKQMEALSSSTAGKLIGLLSQAQKTRLRQIALQDNGPFALRNAEVAKEAGLAPEQRTKIEQVAQQTIKAMDEMSATASDEAVKAPAAKRAAIFKKYQPKLDALENKGKASVLAVLSAPQKIKWKGMLGKPFKG